MEFVNQHWPPITAAVLVALTLILHRPLLRLG